MSLQVRPSARWLLLREPCSLTCARICCVVRAGGRLIDATPEQLITHGIKALAGCVPTDKQLDASNLSVAIIGPEQQFTLIEDAAVQPYLDGAELQASAEDVDMGGEQKDDAGAMAT